MGTNYRLCVDMDGSDVLSIAFLAVLAFLDHIGGSERSWSGHGQHQLNGHRPGVSDWSGSQDIPRHPKTSQDIPRPHFLWI